MPQLITPEADAIIDAAATLAMPAQEKRAQRRQPYRALVALILLDDDGGRMRPQVLRAVDLSAGGLSVRCGHALGTGRQGALQLVRSDGRYALVGVQVRHCRDSGNGEHHCGLRFMPLPAPLEREQFLDERGNLVLLDPLLRENCGREGLGNGQ